MALHRDIYWVGRQWAVTGPGMQCIDQKQKGEFDIEVTRLWDDALVEAMRAKEWLNAADFDKGLESRGSAFRQRDGAGRQNVAPPGARRRRHRGARRVAAAHRAESTANCRRACAER